MWKQVDVDRVIETFNVSCLFFNAFLEYLHQSGLTLVHADQK